MELLQKFLSDYPVSVLKNNMIEVYGQPDIGKTKFILRYLERYMDARHNDTVYYIDSDNKLNKDFLKENNIDLSRFFFSSGADVSTEILLAARRADVLIIDSLPVYNVHRDSLSLYKFLAQLAESVKHNSNIVFIVNQMRCKMNAPGEFRSFYSNLMKEYCSLSIDVDSQKIIKNHGLVKPAERVKWLSTFERLCV